MVRQRHRPFRAALWISCGLYLAACALPATDQWGTASMAGGTEHYITRRGLTCLLSGSVQLLVGKVAWLANPLAVVGALLLIRRRPAGAAAFSAASTFLALLYVLFPSGGSVHPDIPLVGAWLWLGSFIGLTSAAMIRLGESPVPRHAAPGTFGLPK